MNWILQADIQSGYHARAFPIFLALTAAAPLAQAFQGPYLEMRCETYKLLPGDGDAGDHFGWAAAVSGTFAIIGAPKNDSSGSAGPGAGYLFDVSNGVQLAKLVATDGVLQDHFGFSVDVEGAWAIVGAPSHDLDFIFTANPGAAYVFESSTGVQSAKLLSTDIEPGDMLGTAVALHGDLALVGAPGDGENGPGSGSVYLFDVILWQARARRTANRISPRREPACPCPGPRHATVGASGRARQRRLGPHRV